MDDFTAPPTVEQMYGDWGFEWEDAVAMTERWSVVGSRQIRHDRLTSYQGG